PHRAGAARAQRRPAPRGLPAQRGRPARVPGLAAAAAGRGGGRERHGRRAPPLRLHEPGRPRPGGDPPLRGRPGGPALRPPARAGAVPRHGRRRHAADGAAGGGVRAGAGARVPAVGRARAGAAGGGAERRTRMTWKHVATTALALLVMLVVQGVSAGFLLADLKAPADGTVTSLALL